MSRIVTPVGQLLTGQALQLLSIKFLFLPLQGKPACVLIRVIITIQLKPACRITCGLSHQAELLITDQGLTRSRFHGSSQDLRQSVSPTAMDPVVMQLSPLSLTSPSTRCLDRQVRSQDLEVFVQEITDYPILLHRYLIQTCIYGHYHPMPRSLPVPGQTPSL